MFVRTFAERMTWQRFGDLSGCFGDPTACFMSDGDGTGDDSSGSGDDGQQNQSGTKTLSPAEVNAIVEKRVNKLNKKHEAALAAAGTAAVDEWRDEMGLDDAALEKATKQDEVSKQNRVLAKDLKRVRKERDDLKAKNDVIGPKLHETLTKGVVMSAAADKVAPGAMTDVWNRLKGDLNVDDDWNTSVLQDGEPSDLTVDKLIDQLLADHKHLAAPQRNAGSGSRGSAHQGTGNNNTQDKGTGDPVKDLAASLQENW